MPNVPGGVRGPDRPAEEEEAQAPTSDGRLTRFPSREPYSYRNGMEIPAERVDPPLGPIFEDVTEGVGIDAPRSWVPDYYVSGQAFGDFDQDGWLDLYLTDSTGPNRLYRNVFGSFQLVEDQPVSLPEHASGGAIFIDYDNDGDKDLYVVGQGPNVLFENREGSFVDVTEVAGVGDPGQGETATWGDFDQDGFLDLYVANWYCIHCTVNHEQAAQDRLFHNDGDGTFTDVSHLLGARFLDGYAFVGGFVDFDDDGDLDIYLVNDKGREGPRADGDPMNRNAYFRNDGPGCDGWCFTETAIQLGCDARIDGMGIAVADYDLDGDLDMYMSNTPDEVLYRNDGHTFVDVSHEAGVVVGNTTWGNAFLDYDDDGYPDLYVASGTVFGPTNPNKLYRNLGDGTFADVSDGSGADHPAYTIGVAVADYDRDGGVDVVIGNWDIGYRLYRNRRAHSGENGWLSVRLVGGGPVNRDAVGARVTVSLSDGRRLVQEVMAGASLGAGHDLALHFGLGESEIESLDVRWPDGRVDQHSGISPDQELILSY